MLSVVLEPQPDGTCQPTNGSSSASACPLNELNQSGLSCCPTGGQEPQTNGSCAAPTCPGPVTADGRACCAPGSTPTGDDTCQLPGGGLGASCPVAQLTYSGTCCPASSTPNPMGPAGRQRIVIGVGMSARPARQGWTDVLPVRRGAASQRFMPSNAPIPICPSGLTLNSKGQCLAALVCPGSNQAINGAGPCCSPGAQYVTTSESRTTLCVGRSSRVFYGCPLNVPASSCSCSITGFAAVCSGPVTSGTPTTPTCPPGATLETVGDGTYSCVETALEPSCPSPYAVFLNTCVLPDCANGELRNPDGNCVPTKSPPPSTSSSPLPPPPPLPPAPQPAACYAGYALTNGTCVRITRVCAQGEVAGPNGTCYCPIGASVGPTGVCLCPGGDLANGQRCPPGGKTMPGGTRDIHPPMLPSRHGAGSLWHHLRIAASQLPARTNAGPF